MVMAVSACASVTSEVSTAEPTQALILFTPSATRIPLTPTPSPSPAPAAGELLSAVQTSAELTALEAEVIDATEADLVARLGLDEGREPQRVLYESVRWQGGELECENAPLRLTTQGIPGFRIVYLYDEMIFIYRASEDEFMLCSEVNVLEAPPDVLIQIDPVAADLVSLAQRRVAQELDISTRRVNIGTVEVRVWEDASLGCPAEGQTYPIVETNGYRIVLTAGEGEYIFHTSFDRLILCLNEPVNAEDN